MPIKCQHVAPRPSCIPPRTQSESRSFVNPKLLRGAGLAGTPAGKRALRSGVLALVLALGLPAAALAAPLPPDPPRPHGPPHGPPGPAVTVLHLRETAEKTLVPDRLRLEMRAQESGADPRTVQAAINRRMASALQHAHQAAGIAVETGNYALFEETPPHAPPRWRGSQSLILMGEDSARMLKLAGELQSDGLIMSSMTYEVSPEVLRGTQEDLTAEALAALGQRAAAIADRLHLKVLRYRTLTVGNAESGPPPVLRGAAMATAMAMPAPVAAPGRAQIRLTVSAELILGPAPPPHP
ncbi:MAG: SIMPL domain-containing protein [Stellaceae bacterium]